jgi:coenzyme F420 biosynthesis associated uncharacterized protein
VIDWIVAEWIASRVAGSVPSATLVTVAEIDLGPLAEMSEQRVVAYTGLQPQTPLPPPEGIDRREWVATNISAARALIDPVLDRNAAKVGKMKPAAQLAAGFAVSSEIGVLLGYLGQRVLGQYELVLLDEPVLERPPRLLFVLPNLAKAIDNFDADPQEFVTWVALHEVTHAVQFSGVPWLRTHLAAMVAELTRQAEGRLDVKQKFSRPARAEIERRLSSVRHGDLIGALAGPEERILIDKMQATMAVIEGHAEHVMDAVAPDLIPSLGSLRSALNARRRNQSLASRLVGRLLGLEMKMRQYEHGKKFCDAIVAAAGPAALTALFASPESLPTLTEISDPAAWLARAGQPIAV